MRALAVICLTLGCARAPADGTPERALDKFLEACEQAPHDPAAASRAIALLSPSARRALDLRAQRATAVMGRPFTADQVFVPAFTPLRFEIAKMTARIEGDHATVEVVGPDPATQRTFVPMEREGSAWRVALVIP